MNKSCIFKIDIGTQLVFGCFSGYFNRGFCSLGVSQRQCIGPASGRESILQEKNGPNANAGGEGTKKRHEPLGERVSLSRELPTNIINEANPKSPQTAIVFIFLVAWSGLAFPIMFYGARFSARHVENGWLFFGGLAPAAVLGWLFLGALMLAGIWWLVAVN